MWVRTSARGGSSSAPTSVPVADSGPGSIRTPSRSQQPITRGRPRCSTSISRKSGGRGQLALGGERVAQAVLEAARRVPELLHRLVVAGPERDAVGRGDQLGGGWGGG